MKRIITVVFLVGLIVAVTRTALSLGSEKYLLALTCNLIVTSLLLLLMIIFILVRKLRVVGAVLRVAVVAATELS